MRGSMGLYLLLDMALRGADNCCRVKACKEGSTGFAYFQGHVVAI